MTRPAQGEKEKLFWFDFLRAAAAFGVILVHVSADVITEWGVFPKSWWWSANIYDSIARGCVPIFIMISGALLLPVQEGIGDFFRKRFYRVAIPFVAWTILYLLWKKHFYVPHLGFGEALRLAASGGAHFHLWFIYVLVGLYLVTPVFRILAAHASERLLLYFLVLWFVFSSFLPFFEKLGTILIHSNFHINLFVEPAQGFIGYFILGHFLRKYMTERQVPAACAMGTVNLFVCALGTYFLTLHARTYSLLLYENMSPNVVFYAAAVFALAKQADPFLGRALSAGVRRGITGLAKASLGIYLIHPMFIDILAKGRWGFVLKADMPHPAYMIPLTTTVIFLLSFLATWMIQKIPYLKKIV
ncbi:MAG: hypothetical protein A2351_08415 [Omnitrophica bacterium RIFOXYB12_FULL_50_7]|nr:MAG: hypothetical protein A2351_08415 [Omnitrophica bacterium RIFOXYB12_FULL_50_7]